MVTTLFVWFCIFRSSFTWNMYDAYYITHSKMVVFLFIVKPRASHNFSRSPHLFRSLETHDEFCQFKALQLFERHQLHWVDVKLNCIEINKRQFIVLSWMKSVFHISSSFNWSLFFRSSHLAQKSASELKIARNKIERMQKPNIVGNDNSRGAHTFWLDEQ